MEVDITEKQYKKLLRASSITSIQMLMAKFTDRMSKMDLSNVYTDMFVDDTDVSIELCESGEYRGREHVQAFLAGYDAYLADPADKRGWMELQLLCTPYVKLNDSCSEAVGTWSLFCPSAKQATPYPADRQQLTAFWTSGKYLCKFRKVDGQWRFVNLRLVTYLRSPFELGWVKQADCHAFPVLPGLKPDGAPRSYLYNYDYGMGNGGIEWGPYLSEDADSEYR